MSWRAVNALFLVCVVLDGMAAGHMVAFTPLQLAEMGMPDEQVGLWTGLLYSVMTVIAFPLAPFWGPLAERYSRRAIIVRSSGLAAIAYAINAFAPNVWLLLLARVLCGFTYGHVSCIIATQAQITPRQHLGTAIATIQLANPVAASIGPPIGAWLIGFVGVRGLFLLDAGIALAATVLVLFFMPEPPRETKPVSIMGRTLEVSRLVWADLPIRLNFLAWFLSQGGRTIVDVYLPVRIVELSDDPAPAIGAVLGTYGVVTAVATWWCGRLANHPGGVRWFAPAMVLAATVTLGMAYAPWLLLVGVCAVARSVPFAAHQTLLYGHLVRVTPARDQTAVLSITPVPRNIAAFIWPFGAALLAPWGAAAALTLGALAYAANVAVSLVMVRASPPDD
jgi:predicted MFS family arabinose efflux permease